jgi:GH15 family glucan-1,4-alpha-glucosidase
VALDRTKRRIEDCGVIGNTHSVALVSRDGSIDWLCLPRFDSAAMFAALFPYHVKLLTYRPTGGIQAA